MRINALRTKLILSCVVGILVGGCGSAQPPTRGESTDTLLSQTGSARLTADALDMVTASGKWPSSERTLNAANDMLTGRCMKAHGLPFTVPKAGVIDNNDEPKIIDLPRRRREGYGVLSAAQDSKSATAERPQDVYLSTLTPQARQHYVETLFGREAERITVKIPGGGEATYPGQGCQADAIRTLSGTIPSWVLITYVGQQLGNKLADELATAPAYQAALARWRTCMVSRGFHYDTPDQARQNIVDQLSAHGATAALRRREVATAVADGECAARFHLPAAALSSRRTLAADLPEPDRRNLVTLAAARKEAVQRAAAVLAQH
jgi:hypothetical protein